MSKYTKALDKIQGDWKEKSKSLAAPKSGEISYVYKTGAEGKVPAAFWDVKVKSNKNAIPGHQVVIQRYPQSLVAEQYRMLRSSLIPSLERESAKVILISSSIHSEGKTVTVANLAVALAESGQAKVAVIDGDLRRGKLGEYLGFESRLPGLSNYLTNGVAAHEVMLRHSIDRLLVMPRGDAAPNAPELIGSNKFQGFVRELRDHFDYVLIDSPPIMSVADAGILGRLADVALMVIQVGRTPKNVISHAGALFHQAGVKLLGYILTNVEFRSPDDRYYQYYNYSDPYSQAPDLKNFRAAAKVYSKRAVRGLKDFEEKLNVWWDRRVLKRSDRKGL